MECVVKNDAHFLWSDLVLSLYFCRICVSRRVALKHQYDTSRRVSRSRRPLESFRLTVPLHCLIKHLSQICSSHTLSCLNHNPRSGNESIKEAVALGQETALTFSLAHIKDMGLLFRRMLGVVAPANCLFLIPHFNLTVRAVRKMLWPWQCFVFQKANIANESPRCSYSLIRS